MSLFGSGWDGGYQSGGRGDVELGSGSPHVRSAGGAVGGGGSEDFTKLSRIVSDNIQQMNYNTSQVTELVRSLGVPGKDSAHLRNDLNKLIESNSDIASSTASVLKQLGRAGGAPPREKKILQNKLTSDFKRCLEDFQKISKEAKRREAASVPPSRDSTRRPGATRGGGGGGGGSSTSPFYAVEEEEDPRMLAEKRGQMLRLENEREFHDSLIEEREQGIRSIEKTLHEVNEIFIDLAHLVEEQSPMIDSIEAHIDSSVAATTAGVVELNKAEGYQKSSRWKMCVIIALMLVVVLMVVGAVLIGGTVLGLKVNNTF